MSGSSRKISIRIAALSTTLLLISTGFGVADAVAQTASCSHATEAYTGGGGGLGEDPLRARQWGLDQIKAPEAWARGVRGRGALVATIDTGLDLTHPEFAGRVLEGADLLGPADCPGPQDEAGHGTGVAGIIAAAASNGVGIAGIASEARLLPFRVWTGASAPDWNAVTEAVIRAADAGADVINISIYTNLRDPSDESGESTLAKALDYAWEKGAVIVSAAGNDSRPYCSWPARHPHVVCVSATDRSGKPAFYSHLPVHPTGVAVAAPGGTPVPQSVADPSAGCENDDRVWITIWPGSPNDCGPAFEGYDTGSGTSWASAHVSGVAALLAGSGLNNEDIIECIKTSSSNKGSYDPAMGYGMVDAGAAVATCLKDPVPSDPLPFPASVVLPGDYETSGRSYPVIYLIPTIANEDCRDESCPRLKPFLDLLAGRDVITVLPHGGALSDFTDWRGDGPKNQSAFTDHLVPYIDAHYRTIPDRAHRAVAGISAGGYAAVLNASKRPDVFSSAASFSGVMDIVPDSDDRPGGPAFFSGSEPVFDSLDGADPHAVWGDPATQSIWWRNSNPEDLVSNLSGVALFRSSGDGLPCGPDELNQGSAIQVTIESFVHDMNLNYSATADTAGMSHPYHDRCGTHNGFAEGWWSADFAKWLDEALRFDKSPPESFDYKSAEGRFAVWDWSFVTEEARAPEFLYVTDAGRHGLTLMGSGTIGVETPSFVRGKAPVDVQVGNETLKVTPTQGRLRFQVSLGPAHTLQQYSAEQQAVEASGDYFVTEQIRFVVPKNRISDTAEGPRPGPAPGGSSLPGPRVRMRVSDLTPERGASVVFRVRLGRCEGHEGTTIELQTKRSGNFVATAGKTLARGCRARFAREARFGERTFRALWPKQDADHRTGRSRVKKVRSR